MIEQALTTNESFQERMFKKIREQIGELMTDEDLKKIVDSAVNKAFFEQRVVNSGWSTINKEPIIVEKIRDLLAPKVAEVINQWLTANPDAVTKAIDSAIAKGFYGLVEQHIESRMSTALFNFANELKNNGGLAR